MSDKRWFLGVSNTAEVLEKAKNIIAKEINHYIFKMNYAGEQLSTEAFKNWLKSEEDPEEALASRLNRTFDHHVKWSNIQLLLQLWIVLRLDKPKNIPPKSHGSHNQRNVEAYSCPLFLSSWKLMLPFDTDVVMNAYECMYVRAVMWRNEK